ncbi:MAG: hypothetical protein AABZ55_09055, partial [Bdellovibrionota bacterium]
MKFFFQKSPTNDGFTIIEVLIAGGLMTVLMLGFASMMKNQQDQILALRIVSTRDHLRNLDDRYISLPVAIETSLGASTYSGNLMLKTCMQGNAPSANACPNGSTGVFPKCCVAGTYDFFLSDPADLNKTSFFSGTSATPTRYDVDGAICNVRVAELEHENNIGFDDLFIKNAFAQARRRRSLLPPRCIFELASFLQTECQNGDPTCETAYIVSTKYRLQLVPGIQPPAGPV